MSTFYQESAKGLILNQLSESPNYAEVIRLLCEDFDGASDIYDYIAKNLTLDKAKGVWLDLIGDIVGVSRQFEKVIQPTYFGFSGQSHIAGFGNARFYDEGDNVTASSLLNDPEYRVVIHARIARNFGDVSEIGVATSLVNMTNADNVLIYQAGAAAFNAYIFGAISDNIKQILDGTDILPRAAGVKVNLFYSNDMEIFGFADQPFSVGFEKGRFIA